MKQKTGDLRAFLEHEDWIRRLARSLVLDDNRADEIVQQVWLSAIKYKPDTSRNLRPWMAVVARSAAKKLRRSEGRSSRREKIAAKSEKIPSNAVQVDRADVQDALAQFVQGLEEPYRTLIVQHYFEDKPLETIAKNLGIPSSTVRSRLKRVLAEMRIRLDRKFSDRSLWIAAMLPCAEIAPAAPALPASGWIGKSSLFKVAGVAALAITVPTVLLSVPSDDVSRSSEDSPRVAIVTEPESSAPRSVISDPGKAAETERAEETTSRNPKAAGSESHDAKKPGLSFKAKKTGNKERAGKLALKEDE